MKRSGFKELVSLSDIEISKLIIETENDLFYLRFKKIRPDFKPHKVKKTKHYLAQLKTCLTLKQTKN